MVNGQESVKFFPALPSRLVPLDPADSFDNALHASVPIRTKLTSGFAQISGAHGVVLSNPSSADVTITVSGSNPLGTVTPRTFTLPAFATRFYRQPSAITTVNITASAAIRIARYDATVGGTSLSSDLVERTQAILASVTNAASQRATPLSPGEIVTIRGLGLGELTGLNLTSNGRVSTAGPPFGTRVLIGGIPAPILYGSPTQWNVIVPYELEGAASATIQVVPGDDNLEPKRTASLTWTLPVAPTAPGIFTSRGTGLGQASVLNQDNTVNSVDNPAPRGTVIQIFATGLGQVSPNAQTGSVATVQGRTQYPVSVRFNDVDFTPTYAGPAPSLVSGVVQVNAAVSVLAPGNTARVSLVVNGVESPNGITVAVK